MYFLIFVQNSKFNINRLSTDKYYRNFCNILKFPTFTDEIQSLNPTTINKNLLSNHTIIVIYKFRWNNNNYPFHQTSSVAPTTSHCQHSHFLSPQILWMKTEDLAHEHESLQVNSSQPQTHTHDVWDVCSTRWYNERLFLSLRRFHWFD